MCQYSAIFNASSNLAAEVPSLRQYLPAEAQRYNLHFSGEGTCKFRALPIVKMCRVLQVGVIISSTQFCLFEVEDRRRKDIPGTFISLASKSTWSFTRSLDPHFRLVYWLDCLSFNVIVFLSFLPKSKRLTGRIRAYVKYWLRKWYCDTKSCINWREK